MSQPGRLFFFFLPLLASAAGAETRHHVSRYQLWRGCVPEFAVTINSQTFGPTVHAAKGGTADVDVEVNGGIIFNTYKARQGVAFSAGHNGMVDVPEGPEAEPRVYATPTTPFTSDATAQQSPGLNGTMAVWVLEVDEAGQFAFCREHAVLHYDRRHRSTYEKAAAGFAFVALVCTDQISGPTISAVQGDAAYVTVENSPLTEIAIHYRFMVDRRGTYMYHAHYGLQRSAGLNGMIVVAVPPGQAEPFAYDGERTVLLNDWWHKSTYELATGLASVPMVWVGEPQSLSNGGRACFDYYLSGSGIRDATRPGCSPLPAFPVAAGKKTHHIITILSELNESYLLFGRTAQITACSLMALVRIVQVALDHQRRNGAGRDKAVAMAVLILVALPDAAMAARPFHRGGGGHDQSVARGLTPQSRAAGGRSSCTYDPRVQDPKPCIPHKLSIRPRN